MDETLKCLIEVLKEGDPQERERRLIREFLYEKGAGARLHHSLAVHLKFWNSDGPKTDGPGAPRELPDEPEWLMGRAIQECRDIVKRAKLADYARSKRPLGILKFEALSAYAGEMTAKDSSRSPKPDRDSERPPWVPEPDVRREYSAQELDEGPDPVEPRNRFVESVWNWEPPPDFDPARVEIRPREPRPSADVILYHRKWKFLRSQVERVADAMIAKRTRRELGEEVVPDFVDGVFQSALTARPRSAETETIRDPYAYLIGACGNRLRDYFDEQGRQRPGEVMEQFSRDDVVVAPFSEEVYRFMRKVLIAGSKIRILSDGSFAELERVGIPAAVIARLRPLRDREFASAAEFDQALNGVLSTEEVEAHGAGVRRASASVACGSESIIAAHWDGFQTETNPKVRQKMWYLFDHQFEPGDMRTRHRAAWTRLRDILIREIGE